jgi:uncharacterized membrane protein YbhN (UPF0104 family)
VDERPHGSRALPPDAVAPEQGDVEVRLGDTAVDEARRLRRGLISLVILGVLILGLLLAVPGLRHIADRLTDVNPAWVALAIGLEVVSCIGYVLVFQHVFRRAPLRLATRIAFSEMAFGAVVPLGGAGGIAIGAWVVKAKGGSLRRFMERSGVLFLMTSGVNVGTLTLAGLLVGLGVFAAPDHVLMGFLPAACGLTIIALGLSVPRAARMVARDRDTRIARWLRTTAGLIDATVYEIMHPSWRALGAVLYLWGDIAVLWVSFKAFGTPPSIGAMALAFIIGYIGNVLPIPGGVGALDGGLTAALVLYGAGATTSAAAVLVYHGIVLWIPTLLGTIAFLGLRRTIDEPVQLRTDEEIGGRRALPSGMLVRLPRRREPERSEAGS